jgi:predicted ATPase/DNA-binding winged helix-turn-helix (wHTH) protein
MTAARSSFVIERGTDVAQLYSDMPAATSSDSRAIAMETAIEFGRFRVLPRRRQLLADGVPLELGSRAFDVLMALLEARGLLVTKDELMTRVWPGTVVEENNLQVQISTLRKALGDDRDFIRTISGYGYRFTAEVSSAAAGPVASPLLGLAPHSGGSVAEPLTNLPAPVSEFINRHSELAEMANLVGTHRLVTVIGPGGVGKTRLALEVAGRLLSGFADGVWLAEFAALSDPALVNDTLLASLGLRPRGADDAPDRLVVALRRKSLLVVLDNCEHVVEAAARSAQRLLQAGPKIHVIATSQEPLGVDGEHVLRLAPFDVPSVDEIDLDEPMRHAAIRLFMTRVRAADPAFAFDARTIRLVRAICRRLDGIPLAIELAAARAATLGIEEVASGLDRGFRLLTEGCRTSLPRHRTLRAALDWSYALLAAPHRAMACRLAVFSDGFTLAAARAMASESLGEPDVVDSVAALVAKSLLVVEHGGAEPRYRFLETTRSYLLEKLAESGETARLSPETASIDATSGIGRRAGVTNADGRRDSLPRVSKKKSTAARPSSGPPENRAASEWRVRCQATEMPVARWG